MKMLDKHKEFDDLLCDQQQQPGKEEFVKLSNRVPRSLEFQKRRETQKGLGFTGSL